MLHGSRRGRRTPAGCVNVGVCMNMDAGELCIGGFMEAGDPSAEACGHGTSGPDYGTQLVGMGRTNASQGAVARRGGEARPGSQHACMEPGHVKDAQDAPGMAAAC